MPGKNSGALASSDLPFADACKLWRRTMGWSHERAALEIGTYKGTFTNIERGAVRPTINMMQRIRDITGFDLYVLAYLINLEKLTLTPEIRASTMSLRDQWLTSMERMRRVKHLMPLGKW